MGRGLNSDPAQLLRVKERLRAWGLREGGVSSGVESRPIGADAGRPLLVEGAEPGPHSVLEEPESPSVGLRTLTCQPCALR